MRDERKVIALTPEQRKELKELFIKTERTYRLAQYPETRYISQDEAGEFAALAFGIAPLVFRDGKNEVKAQGFTFWIHQELLPKSLMYKYQASVMNFRAKLEPRTVYKFRKFSAKEIDEMLKKEKEKRDEQ